MPLRKTTLSMALILIAPAVLLAACDGLFSEDDDAGFDASSEGGAALANGEVVDFCKDPPEPFAVSQPTDAWMANGRIAYQCAELSEQLYCYVWNLFSSAWILTPAEGRMTSIANLPASFPRNAGESGGQLMAIGGRLYLWATRSIFKPLFSFFSIELRTPLSESQITLLFSDESPLPYAGGTEAAGEVVFARWDDLRRLRVLASTGAVLSDETLPSPFGRATHGAWSVRGGSIYTIEWPSRYGLGRSNIGKVVATPLRQTTAFTVFASDPSPSSEEHRGLFATLGPIDSQVQWAFTPSAPEGVVVLDSGNNDYHPIHQLGVLTPDATETRLLVTVRTGEQVVPVGIRRGFVYYLAERKRRRHLLRVSISGGKPQAVAVLACKEKTPQWLKFVLGDRYFYGFEQTASGTVVHRFLY